MIKLAFYGKGGIGKSTTVSNVALAMARRGLTVMQIGCDPKADSTRGLCGGAPPASVMDLIRARGDDFALTDAVKVGVGGVICAEAGGPLPGLGCAGRGVITALETLAEKGIYETVQPDVVLFDVLGDVVCGGFALPMRRGYAQKVYILTSGENMAIYAAANIAAAVAGFKNRGYASLGGLILNRRDVTREDEKVAELARDFDTRIVGDLPRDARVPAAEEAGQMVLEAYPQAPVSAAYRALAAVLCAENGLETRC
ncbi:AAA family ATPase [Pseudoramibacter sp. HA2172]|uniref:nucleotide-binding protein n=1 Tax=Pseudoramibacter faecis TaxID=3108534 RepID=UPI002E77FC56|nr:AAA family ATPase [Pseudoramibacter sp. HA2172]